MQNFTFSQPTKIIFGRGTELQVGEETKKYGKKILLMCGGGSIKKTGLYDKVVKSLKENGVDFVELWGAQPNPRLSLVRDGIKLCRENNVDFVLAVGAGSAIDTGKAIALGTMYDGDVWDLYSQKVAPTKALKIGTILTLPATGSEASASAVITNEDGWFKRGLNSEFHRPVFSILNPELCYTLPPYQTACGAVDIMAHIMERYFTNVKNVELIDRMSEGALKTVIRNAYISMEKPDDYDARAEVMWAGTLAHNDLLGTGRIGDWGPHRIEHELSGIYDIAHGAGLAILYPAWMKFVYKHDIGRFAQFAVRVFDVDMDFSNPENTALEGIKRYEQFCRDLGLPVRLSEAGISDDRFDEMASKFTNNDTVLQANFVKLNKADTIKILELAK